MTEDEFSGYDRDMAEKLIGAAINDAFQEDQYTACGFRITLDEKIFFCDKEIVHSTHKDCNELHHIELVFDEMGSVAQV